jgi:hypothetical protein
MSVFYRIGAILAFWMIGLSGWAHAAPASAPSPAAGSVPQAEAFLKSADALYRAAVQGETREILRRLGETEERLRMMPMRGIASAEGIEALARSVARMKRAAASVTSNPSDWRTAAAEIRLAADALAHPRFPVWHGYRPIMHADVQAVADSLERGGPPSEALKELRRLEAHYGLIRTSVLLQAEPHLIERSDSILRYAQRVLSAPAADPSLLQSFIPSLRDSMDGLFPAAGSSQTTLVAPLSGPAWGWTAIMGTFIVTILSWAGWQRYRTPGRVTPRGNLPPERRERH